MDSLVHKIGVVADQDMPMGSWIPYVAKPSTNTASEFAATIQSVEYDLMPGMEKTAGHFVNEVPEDPLFLVFRVACQLAYFPKHLDPIDCQKAVQACRENAVLVRGLFTDMYVPLVTFGEVSGQYLREYGRGRGAHSRRVHKCGEALLRNMHQEVFSIPKNTALSDASGFMSIVLDDSATVVEARFEPSLTRTFISFGGRWSRCTYNSGRTTLPQSGISTAFQRLPPSTMCTTTWQRQWCRTA